MDKLAAIKCVASRQADIFQNYGVLVRFEIDNDGVLILASWRDSMKNIFNLSKRLSWAEVETAADPRRLLNDRVNVCIQAFQKTKAELGEDDQSVAPSAPYSGDVLVPLWERNDSCCGLGDT